MPEVLVAEDEAELMFTCQWKEDTVKTNPTWQPCQIGGHRPWWGQKQRNCRRSWQRRTRHNPGSLVDGREIQFVYKIPSLGVGNEDEATEDEAEAMFTCQWKEDAI